jgi:phthalate 4,5-cis-dihydrodiol dehydrogenase
MVHALNYTDFLYRPRRPEELDTARGGGVVFSQAAHQVDVVRRLVGAPVTRVRAQVGAWDPARDADGAYTAFLTFAGGAARRSPTAATVASTPDELMGWNRRDRQAQGPEGLRSRAPPSRRRLVGGRPEDASAPMARPTPRRHRRRTHEHFGR